jgi:lambda family phage portal protein
MTASAWKNGLSNLAAQQRGEPAAAASATAYRGAAKRRAWSSWDTRERSGDAAIYEDHRLLNSRMRDLFRNEPLMRKLKLEMSKGVIGAEGIQTFAEVSFADGQPGESELDDAFNFESDDLFELWCEEADIEGKLAWPEMQWQHFEEIIGNGGGFLLECMEERRGRLLPLCYQSIEYEQLDDTQDRPGSEKQNRVLRGIEFDRLNRPVAYWLYDVHPHDTWQTSTKSTRVPAERIIHTFFPDRPSQNLGATLFSANVQSAKDLDWYLGNELTAAAIGALFSVMIKRDRGAGSGLGFTGDGSNYWSDTDPYGNAEARLGQGIICDLGANDEVVQVQANRPNSQAAAFIELILRQAGQAIGLSMARVTGDYKATSYSAGRAMHLDDEAYFRVLRAWCGRSFAVRVRRRFTEVAAAYGLFRTVGARQFVNHRRQMLRVDCIGAGREQLDPEKETSASLARLRSHTSTFKHEYALKGRHYRKELRQCAREQKLLETLKLKPDLTANGKPPVAEEPAGTEVDNADAA